MSSCGLAATVFLACVITFTTAQSSCKDRCGMGYYRGYSCQCDYSCLLYGECCDDYESLCTTKSSCKGRCGETFKRGRQCNCDAECAKYNQCCADYKDHCDESELSPGATEQSIEEPLTLSEGNDPDDTFFPTINPTNYPQDEPDSASNQIVQTGYDGPDSSPLPEGSSGSPPTDLLEGLTAGPPLPDLDGFEILPEPATVTSETSTALPQDQTTAEFTSVGPSTQETTVSTQETTVSTVESTVHTLETDAASTDAVDANDNTITPEPTTVVNSASTQTTSEPITSFTDFQTEPKLPEDATLMSETTVPYTEATTLSSLEITNAPEATEETTPLKPTTIAPTNEETTAIQEIDTTESATVTVPTTAEAVSEMSTAVTTNAASESTTVTKQETSQSPTSSSTSTAPAKPDPEKPFKPVLSPEHKPVLNGLGTNTDHTYQADDSNDTNLCSGRPISGATTLSNGTVVVFRGHFFWVLDRDRVPGPAQGITQVWGVPSPIDTVFTRCNCQGKTYIFKGPQYWRYENDVLDRGYPKVVETGFDGLRGHITAALSVPQYKQRKEAVYFFKRGGTVQRYSYQFGTNPSCGRKVHYAVYTNRNRIARQVQAQVSLLEPAINYRKSWPGFSNIITAAVSIPNNREPEGYSYYVFSRSKSYNIRMSGNRPAIAVNEPNASHQSNEVFKCPKKSRS